MAAWFSWQYETALFTICLHDLDKSGPQAEDRS